MSDLISRQAAIAAICKAGCSISNPCMVVCPDVMAVKEVPSANQWIPVSERPPEDLQEVVVTWINREYAPIKDIPQTGCAVYYDGCWYWSSATCIEILKEYGKNDIDLIDHIIEITAWKPLPEPYKGEEK